MRTTSIGNIVSGLIRIICDAGDEESIKFAYNTLKSKEIDKLMNNYITDNMEGLSISEKQNVMTDADLWYLVRKDLIDNVTNIEDLMIDRTCTFNLKTNENKYNNKIINYLNIVYNTALYYKPFIKYKDTAIIGVDNGVKSILDIVSARYEAFNIPTYGIDRERIVIPLNAEVDNLSEMVLALINYRYNR
jgi:hypothetical protein